MHNNNITFTGTVVHGKKLGRTIGFPTANVSLQKGIVEDGVYALDIKIGELEFLGVGTYKEDMELFEAFIFDLTANLYGTVIQIKIKDKIRNNQKFDSLDDLKAQIEKDVIVAKG